MIYKDNSIWIWRIVFTYLNFSNVISGIYYIFFINQS